MKHNTQSYFDAAQKVRNTKPLLTNDEILQHLSKVSPPISPVTSAWKMKAIVGSTALVAGLVVLYYYGTLTNTILPNQTPHENTQSAKKIQENTPIEQPIASQIVNAVIQAPQENKHPKTERSNFNHISSLPSQLPQVTNELTPSEQSADALSMTHEPESRPEQRTNGNDIKGLERIELSEQEAIVLATHYPKLHVWLQGKFSTTDTCDITLAPTDKNKSYNALHHSALLLRINFEHSDSREFLLWFTPNKEFTNALPVRLQHQLLNELHVLAEVETLCMPAEQACKAVKNDSPFFDLCRRESGALSGVFISPNPARENAECTFNLKEEREVNISLHDLNGRFVRTMIFNEFKPSGENKVPLMLDGIPAGAYLLAIRTHRGEQAVQQLAVGQ